MRIARHTLSLALLATAACADSATAPKSSAAAPSAAVVAPSASDIVYNTGSGSLSSNGTVTIQVPTQFAVQDRCAGGRFGEIIVFQGNQHLVFNETANAAGHYSMKLQWNADDVVGIGQYTGFTYRATGVTQYEYAMNGSFPYTESSINNYHVIGQGQATNGNLHETVHFTVNANGDVTAWVTDYNFDCQGTPSF